MAHLGYRPVREDPCDGRGFSRSRVDSRAQSDTLYYMTKNAIFQVGGAVRDDLMGRESKDLDFAVVMDGDFPDAMAAFATMVRDLDVEGFRIFEIKPDFFTVRAHFPKSHPMHGKTTADFVMARVDGPSSDGRHPDFVQAGTLLDDQRRRDFTINSIAKAEDGTLIDPFDGRADIKAKLIRAVGEPRARFVEDSLRVLRAFRFSVTLGFKIHSDTMFAITSDENLPERLSAVSTERKREELDKMFKVDTLASLRLLGGLSPALQEAIFSGNLRLSATQKR